MTSLLKLVETSRIFSMIFDFRIKCSRNIYLSVISILIRAILLITVGLFVILLQVFLYFLYLNMFFTALPGNLVKKIRIESLGYDSSNKWLFNISYLMLYLFVLIFEFAYIFTNYLIVIFSFVIDCFMWVLTLGKTKLNNTQLSLNDKSNVTQNITNTDILAIILTFVSILLFYVLGEINLLNSDLDFVSWLYMSIPIILINFLFYLLFYKKKAELDSESEAEDKVVSVK
jgi:hypothetical protein